MTTAVTIALRERLVRERQRRELAASLPARVSNLATRLRASYDTRPVSREEWDAASGAPLLFIGDDFGTTDL